MTGESQLGPGPERRIETASADRPVEETVWQRLFELLYRELAASTQQALARGVTPTRLAAHLDERAALLRAHLNGPPAA